MSGSIFNYIGNLDTLIAVIVGPVLATGGAQIAETIQARSMIKQREQDAARRLGHILFDIDRSLARRVDSTQRLKLAPQQPLKQCHEAP